MPDDNSCLFRALGYALLANSNTTATNTSSTSSTNAQSTAENDDIMTNSAIELRQIVARSILAQPEVYTRAVLQRDPEEYARWIQQPDSWGGYVDIQCVAQWFGVQVCGVDVQTGVVTRYGGGQDGDGSGNNNGHAGGSGPRLRCFVVYSGIHYDAVAFVPAGLDPAGEWAFDVRQFDVGDDEMLEGVRQLAQALKERHYYTDTARFTIKCGRCGWMGKGEREAERHAMQSGHQEFQEA